MSDLVVNLAPVDAVHDHIAQAIYIGWGDAQPNRQEERMVILDWKDDVLVGVEILGVP